MAVDDKARLALEKQLVQQKKEEADLQKKINQMVTDGADQRKKSYKDAVKDLETQKELTQQAKNRLKDHSTFTSMQKNLNKSLSQATKQTKTLVDYEEEKKSIQLLGVESDFSEKEILEEILKHRNKMIGLSQEQELLDYDHESTMDAINEMIGDREGMHEGHAAMLDEEIKKSKSIAESLNKQTAATQMSADAQEGILGALGTSKQAMKGLVAGARQFLAAIMANPIMAIGAVLVMALTTLIKMAKHVREVSENFGVSYATATKFAFEMGKVNPMLRMAGVDVEKLGASLFDTFKTVGAVTTDNMNKLGMLNLKFGVTSDTAAGLAQIVQRELGGSIGENIDRVGVFAKEFEAAGVGVEAALADMVQNSKFLYEYMGGSVDQFVQATIEAKKLGLNLGTVSQIADSLLDFETSIANTMNASLLIGRQLNFDRARGLALEGDTLGAVQDITKQLGGVAEYQKLNVLQRRGLAEALGVGTDELSALIRGEAVEMKGDPLINSNKDLIEAINSNTVAITGEEIAESKKDKQKERSLLDQQIALASEELAVMKSMKTDMHKVAGVTNN